jgi:hypothetical protein
MCNQNLEITEKRNLMRQLTNLKIRKLGPGHNIVKLLIPPN